MTTAPLAVSIATAAGMLELPDSAIRQAVYDGQLPALRIGSRLRVEVDSLKLWFRSSAAMDAVMAKYEPAS